MARRLWILFENLRIGRNLGGVTRGVEGIVSGNSLKQKAASSTVWENGPIWSREEANAAKPYLDTIP